MRIRTKLGLSLTGILLMLIAFAMYSSSQSYRLELINNATTKLALIQSNIYKLKALHSNYTLTGSRYIVQEEKNLIAKLQTDLQAVSDSHMSEESQKKINSIQVALDQCNSIFDAYAALIDQNIALKLSTYESKLAFIHILNQYTSTSFYDQYSNKELLLEEAFTTMNDISYVIYVDQNANAPVALLHLEKLKALGTELKSSSVFEESLFGQRIITQSTTLTGNINKYMANQSYLQEYSIYLSKNTDFIANSTNELIDLQKTYSLSTSSAINFSFKWLIVVIVIFSIAITLLISQNIAHALKQLIAISSDIASGNYNVRLKENAKTEFGALSMTINQMAQSLEVQTTSLRMYSDDLEKIIAEKTKELMATQEELLASNEHLLIEKSQLIELSTLDSLTRLKNHGYIMEALQDKVKNARRYQHTFSVLMLDIDHFKSINDRYGHQLGDDVLVAVADILSHYTREVDLIGRYGGEEFLVLFGETTLDQAFISAERIREALSKLNFGPSELTVTKSGGLTAFSDDTGNSVLKRADDLMYQAKAAGRNQIICG